MTVWLDNQLPPALAAWMRVTCSLDCVPVRDLHLQRASDPEIFMAARQARAVVMTKDADFVELLEQHGPPPQVVLVTCGNTSKTRLRRLVAAACSFPCSTAAKRWSSWAINSTNPPDTRTRRRATGVVVTRRALMLKATLISVEGSLRGVDATRWRGNRAFPGAPSRFPPGWTFENRKLLMPRARRGRSTRREVRPRHGPVR